MVRSRQTNWIRLIGIHLLEPCVDSSCRDGHLQNQNHLPELYDSLECNNYDTNHLWQQLFDLWSCSPNKSSVHSPWCSICTWFWFCNSFIYSPPHWSMRPDQHLDIGNNRVRDYGFWSQQPIFISYNIHCYTIKQCSPSAILFLCQSYI